MISPGVANHFAPIPIFASNIRHLDSGDLHDVTDRGSPA